VHFQCGRAGEENTRQAEISLKFSVGGKLVLTGRQNCLNSTSLKGKLSSRWSNKVGKIIPTDSQSAKCPACNKPLGAWEVGGERVGSGREM